MPLEGPFETLDVYDYLVTGFQGQIVVCYTFTQRPTPAAPVEQGVGVATLEQRGVTQYTVVNHHTIKTQHSPPFVMYGRFQHINGLVVYGRIFNAEVAAVRVTLNTGKPVRAVPKQGGFVVQESATEVREVQVLGANNQVLQQYNQPSFVTQNP